MMISNEEYLELEDLAIRLFPGPSTRQEAKVFIRAILHMATGLVFGSYPTPPIPKDGDQYDD